jgi:TolB-like protein
MDETNSPLQPCSENRQHEVHACLKKMLTSTTFASSPRQKRLLAYLVEHALDGHADRLKGYTIGVEVFDRDADFDPNLDSIVRVEVARLRSKLRDYYDNERRNDTVRIELPKGGYAPSFIFEENAANPSMTVSTTPPQFTADKPSLLVLPLANIGADPSQDYFADGITDTLISELSRFSGLMVISRQTSFAYKNSTNRGDQIAAELGVQHLLEGSVQRLGERARIAVQLVHAPSGQHLWSERFDCELGDIFALQDDVTRRIVSALHVQLTRAENEQFGHDRTNSIEAHDALLRGLQQHWQYTPTSNDAARAFFTKALQLDPNYAAALAWLARAQTFQWIMRFSDDDSVLESALGNAQSAVTLQPRMPYALSVLGWVQLWRGQGESSLAASWKAVSLAPHNAEANMMLAMGLSAAGRGEEALFFIEEALRLNPHPSAFYQFALAQCHMALDEFNAAIAALKRGYEINDTFIPTPITLCLIYAWLGREQEMLTYREKTLALLGCNKSSIHYPWLDPRLRARHEEMIRLAGLQTPNCSSVSPA